MQIINLLLFLPLLASALSWLPTMHPLMEANLSLGVYYLVHHLIALPAILLLKLGNSKRERMLWSLLALLLIGGYARTLLPFYFPPTAQSSVSGDPLRVLFANVYLANPDYRQLKDQIETTAPDVVGLVEVDSHWLQRLSLAARYPYKVEIPRDDHYGIALYSKLPFERTVPALGEDLPPVVLGTLTAGKSKITLACLHAVNPIFGGSSALSLRNLTLRRLVSRLREVEGAILVMGDFNATPFSKHYRIWTEESDFRDAMWGFGLWRSWDAYSSVLRLTIDHILYRGDLSVERFQMLPFNGSDHLPILVDLGI